jgi:hypothetical protein
MDENRARNTVQHDQPARGHPEARKDTVWRATTSADLAGAERGGLIDPSTRRGLNRTLAGSLIKWTAGGAIGGGALGLVLSIAPGPFSTSVPMGSLVGAGVFAVAGAVIAFATGPLLTLEREDGRVEDEVEVAIGRVTTPATGHSDGWIVEDADDAARAENEGYPLGHTSVGASSRERQRV